MITKLYCFVDETGQDTNGELFLVAVVIKEIAQIAALEKSLEVIENRTGKKLLKWKKTHKNVKKKYLEALLSVKELKKAIYYATYQSSKEYSKLTSLTIAKAVLANQRDQYTVTVIIDGLNNKERDVVRDELKKLNIHYRKIRGMKDEQNIFLRLSDAMAGFLRDAQGGESYTKTLFSRFKTSSIVSEA